MQSHGLHHAGIGGSALEAEVNRTDVPAWYCDRKTNGYRLLFLALNEAARPACFVDELLVTYDAGAGRCVRAPLLGRPGRPKRAARTDAGTKQRLMEHLLASMLLADHPGCMLRRYRNQTGVQIRPLDFGGLGGLRALDPYLPQLTSVYGKLIRGLEAEGYKERVDLFGAPYDFRLAADGLEQACSVATTAAG